MLRMLPPNPIYGFAQYDYIIKFKHVHRCIVRSICIARQVQGRTLRISDYNHRQYHRIFRTPSATSPLYNPTRNIYCICQSPRGQSIVHRTEERATAGCCDCECCCSKDCVRGWIDLTTLCGGNIWVYMWFLL